MVTVTVETVISAPKEKCFDLARSLAAHTATTGKTNERIAGEHNSDLLVLGDEVTFEAKHLGFRQKLTSKIVQFDSPHSFTDQMLRGAFKSLVHRHVFESLSSGQTKMTDILIFESPFGPIGRLFDNLFLRHYMEKFIRAKGQALKQLAEMHSRNDGIG